MADPVLQLSGIVKDYGEAVKTRVLHGVDVSIGPGELTALIGPSGSGKSTLLNIMGLLERPTAGKVLLGGQDMTTASDDVRARARGEYLGFIFQFHHLLLAFTAAENVYMPLFAGKGRKDAKMAARAQALLQRVGLGDKVHRKATDLSGGQQQRVAIARALAGSPKLILADEPTGNLDTETADQIFDLFREINQRDGTALLVVTHDPRLADRCDRIIRVVDGRVASDARGAPAGPCRACGFGPCVKDACIRSADIPRDFSLQV